MGQLQLKRISKEIIDHAEQGVVSEQSLPKVVDDFIVQRLKEDEMQHAEVDSRMYEGLRKMVQSEVLPLYEKYRQETARIRERSLSRKLWQYVLGTVGALEILEALLTKGRAFAPQVLVPSAILYSFIGAILYTSAQYLDNLQLARARKRLETAIAGLEGRLQTDMDYDHRRRLLDTDILRAEAVEMLAHYQKPEDFWRDYVKVREADPSSPADAKALNTPQFDRFLKFHLDGQYSPLARQQRFDRLFIEAQEIFLSRDREHYALNHLKNQAGKL
jgi:hypothetical protein